MTVGVHLPYGLAASGRLVSIADANRGAADGLICPGCRAPLVARKGQVLRHHFAHASDTACEGAYETMLHLLGKQIIAEVRHVKLPDVSGRILSQTAFIADEEFVDLDEVGVEQAFGSFRPDLLVKAGGWTIAIEILVTHRCTPEKVAAYRAASLDSIEIDLGHLRGCEDPVTLADGILQSAPRRWIFSRRFEEARIAAEKAERARLAKYAAEMTRMSVQMQRARDAEIAREAERLKSAIDRVNAKIYEPGDPDPLRDGLYRGFHEHMARLRATSETAPDER